ncbi:DUF4372 domain-containing protein [Daejeonella sp.]|uniref:DUF4372 domain-containing protein n=1 Tax=Daejeonella sp. TaxID=2805397 RepID=UPI0030C1B4D2
MPKSTYFTGQPILGQLLSLISRPKVEQLAKKHQSNRYCKKFKTYNHLVTMLFSSFHHCSSLRELITGLQANSSRLGLEYNIHPEEAHLLMPTSVVLLNYSVSFSIH